MTAVDVDDALVWQVASGELQELARIIEPLVPVQMRDPPQKR
jgi:hypothetical protein